MHDLTERLSRRAALSGLDVPKDLVVGLAAYYRLLERWNEKINLTSLVDPDEAVDRLLLEPVAAARRLPAGARLIDLGSGGGSPAIPLALATGAAKLVMVESRERKASFLREAVRQLDISAVASVETARFEALAELEGFGSAFDVVSVRAVRLDRQTLVAASRFTPSGGTVALFRGPNAMDRPPDSPDELVTLGVFPLLKQSSAKLVLLRRA